MESKELESQTRQVLDGPDSGSGNRDGHKHEEGPNREDRIRSLPKWKNTIKNFSLLWFAIAMNTGIIAILMRLLPYQFHGLPVLSTIMYIFDLVLFSIFMVATLLRLSMFPKAAQNAFATNVDELAFLGAIPVAFLTLTDLTALIVSNSYWGGHAWSLVSYVMWWFATAWMLATAFGVTITLFRTKLVHDRSLTPGLFLPIVGLATDAVVGASICNYGSGVSARLAVPVIITSYMLSGIAFFFAIMLYTLYLHHLMAVGFPESGKTPQLFMLVGPCGQIAASQILLASAVQTKMDFAMYAKGTFLTSSAASGVSPASIVLGLLLVGFDLLWLAIALAGVIEALMGGKMKYSMAWWATIFPLATLALAFYALSVALDSPTFRVLNTALLLILLVDYFVNWAFTIWHSIRGDFLVKPAVTEKVE